MQMDDEEKKRIAAFGAGMMFAYMLMKLLEDEE